LDEETLDLREYYIAIRRHLLGIIIFALIATTLAAYLLQFVPDIYKADASIFIETKESNIVSIEGMYQVDMGENEYFNTQISMLKSRTLAENVNDELQLIQHREFKNEKSKIKTFIFNLEESLPEFLKPIFQSYVNKEKLAAIETPEMQKQRILLQLMEKLSISRIENSNLIRISFETQSADLAAKVPNKLAELYIQGGLNTKSKDNKQALGNLTERVASIKKQLHESEQKLLAYRNKHNLLDLGGVNTLESSTIEVISTELLEARKARTEIEIIHSQIQEIRRPTIEKYEAIPRIMDNSLIQNVRRDASAAQSNLVELSKQYGKKHPRIQSAISQYKKARLTYAETIKGVITGIRNQYRAAVQYEKELERDLSKLKRDIQNINNKGYQLRLLENEVEENSNLLETFSTRLKETKEASNLDNIANATIVDGAVTPTIPTFPKRTIIILVIFVVSLGFAMVVAFVSESMVKTFRFPEDIEKYLHAPFLGILPRFKSTRKELKTARLPYLEDKRSLYAESIRTIRTGILLSLVKMKRKIIIVTSSVPAEGKTTASLNLAIAMGKTQKVIIIDTDMRKSTIAKKCGIETNIGLSTLLTDRSTLDESIHVFEEWEIDVLPGGEISNHPQELLCSDKFSQILDTLNNMYDLIIIDSAPVAPVADTLLLTNIVENIVFVVRSDSTPHSMAQSCIDKLKGINANIIGVVLNDLDVNKASKYRPDDYYGGYYDDYGYNKSS